MKLDANFLKLFTASLFAGIIFFGYAYAHQFYRGFGISFAELDMTPLDIFFRGIYVVIFKPSLFASTIAILLLISIIFSFSIHFKSLFSYSLVLVSLISFLFFSSYLGKREGIRHATLITQVGAGKIAYCTLLKEDGVQNPLAELIASLSRADRLRFLAQNNRNTYLAVVSIETTSDIIGQSYVIPNDSIEHCRIIGTK